MGSMSKNEKLHMKINETKDVVDFSALKEQTTPSLASRGIKSRGVDVTPVTGSLFSIAAEGIRKFIASERKKYTAYYQFALTDLYFYDQLSTEGPFDPVGLQFNGFKMIRTFIDKQGNTDTAFRASFVLDTSNAYEILNNSIFRLRLEDVELKYAKAKVASTNAKILNMDIEISFQTSYVNQDGILFDNINLGKFYMFLRKAPLDSTAENYYSYYSDLKGKLLIGRSFTVPRSFGYHMEDGHPTPGYSQGAYSIIVKVKESSKEVFITKLILESTGSLIEANKIKAVKSVNKQLPAKMR
jgi:hypothetical protein